MTDLAIQSTGVAYIDRILEGIVGIYTQFFSTRLHAFYVIGSYADQSAVAISDIDLCIVFKGPIKSEEAQQATQLRYYCERLSPVRLDISINGEEDLSVAERVMITHGGVCVFGEDIRATLQLPSLDAYRKAVTWVPYRFLGQVIRQQQIIAYPLAYPDASSEFYGYEQVRLPEWYPGGIQQGIKELVTGILRTATAIIALQTGQYVGSKRASVHRYREYIHDEWSDYLELLYQKGKCDWQYLIPTDQADRQLLRSLCEQTLAFENHYFRLYRDYLLKLLHGREEDQILALQRLTEVVYTDQEMHQATQEALQSSHH